jgi:hypothetical protein
MSIVVPPYGAVVTAERTELGPLMMLAEIPPATSVIVTLV